MRAAIQAQYDLNALLHIIDDCGGAGFRHDREDEMAVRMHEYAKGMTRDQRDRLMTAAVLELAKYLEHFDVDIPDLIRHRVAQLPHIEANHTKED